MYAKNILTHMKAPCIFIFILFFATSTHTLHIVAGESGLGVINGTITAKKPKYLRDAVVYIENVPNTFEPQQNMLLWIKRIWPSSPMYFP